MNIFVLDEDPYVAAELHCDKHVVKMILETAQMLSTARDSLGLASPYSPTHRNHPCTLWTAKSQANYYWLHSLGIALYGQYVERYGGKTHKSGELLFKELRTPLAKAFPNTKRTQFVQAMPEMYKQDDPVRAYRCYYLGDKVSLLEPHLKTRLQELVKDYD